MLVGVAHFPALNETVYAARGMGCFWNGRRARVSTVSNLADSVLLMSEVDGYGDKTAAWQKLIDSTYIQRTWGDSYGYLLVATGRAEIMLDAEDGGLGLRAVRRDPRRSGRHIHRLAGHADHLRRRVDGDQRRRCSIR